jgi:hypothetical protein
MTKKEFMNRVAHAKDDFLQNFLDILKKNKNQFCAVGGLAVNAYAEPVVSLDLDIVILVERLDDLLAILKKKYSITEFSNSINIAEPASDLRIQIQTDKRYQSFIKRAVENDILGYKIPVAAIEDVLQGKIWAAMDETMRASKRQKDLADILRLVEVREDLISIIPESLKNKLFGEK